MGGNGTDATPGTKGGKGGKGGDGGEAGEWSLEALPEVPLSAFVIRTGGLGGAGGAGGPGGSRAFGGAGGEGGVGGEGGEGGPPGARGHCKSQNRMWTAYKNWHDSVMMTPITVSGIVGVTNTQLMTPAPTLLLLLKLENALIGGVDTWDIREQKERMVLKAQLATLGWMRKQQRWGRRVVLVKMRRNLVPKSFIYTNQ